MVAFRPDLAKLFPLIGSSDLKGLSPRDRRSTPFLTKFSALLNLPIMPDGKKNGISRITACTMNCPDACSLVVTRTEDGNGKVKGNPANPFIAGSLATGHWLLARSKKREAGGQNADT